MGMFTGRKDKRERREPVLDFPAPASGIPDLRLGPQDRAGGPVHEDAMARRAEKRSGTRGKTRKAAPGKAAPGKAASGKSRKATGRGSRDARGGRRRSSRRRRSFLGRIVYGSIVLRVVGGDRADGSRCVFTPDAIAPDRPAGGAQAPAPISRFWPMTGTF